MGTALYWVGAFGTEDPVQNEELANKWQWAAIMDLLMAHFNPDPPIEAVAPNPEWWCNATWKKLDAVLPPADQVKSDEFVYQAWRHRGDGSIIRERGQKDSISQEMYSFIRPIIRRVAESGREVEGI
jgi:hypothetical protein